MKRGEALILATMGLLVAGLMVRNAISLRSDGQPDRGIPFYSTANPDLARMGGDLYRSNSCRQCHSLWSVKSPFESVPAPSLDGIGSLRSEQWLYDYFSAPDPQRILPSRLKSEYRMPSLKDLPEADRRTLAQYMASLKVKDWYLDGTRAAEYEKLTGKAYPGSHGEN
ncbi:MAG: c-type cytochrome [Steroidobacteraceae bacterium]|jgi:cbb3-type cytochrome oxidase cytochrome c subunit